MAIERPKVKPKKHVGPLFVVCPHCGRKNAFSSPDCTLCGTIFDKEYKEKTWKEWEEENAAK